MSVCACVRVLCVRACVRMYACVRACLRLHARASALSEKENASMTVNYLICNAQSTVKVISWREEGREKETDRQAGSQAELAEQKERERERALRQMTHYDASLQGSTSKKHSP